jgi:hypothetical protein
VAAVSAECGQQHQKKLVAQGGVGMDGLALRIQNFGSFNTVRRKARIGRDPRTGEAIDIPAIRSVSFTPAMDFKNEVNMAWQSQ